MSSADTPEEAVSNAELRELVRLAIAELPHEEAVLVRRHYLQYGDQLETLTTTGGLMATPSIVSLDMQTVKAGINYRFR